MDHEDLHDEELLELLTEECDEDEAGAWTDADAEDLIELLTEGDSE